METVDRRSRWRLMKAGVRTTNHNATRIRISMSVTPPRPTFLGRKTLVTGLLPVVDGRGWLNADTVRRRPLCGRLYSPHRRPANGFGPPWSPSCHPVPEGHPRRRLRSAPDGVGEDGVREVVVIRWLGSTTDHRRGRR